MAATAAARVAVLFALLGFAHHTSRIAEVACRCKRRFQWRGMLPRWARTLMLRKPHPWIPGMASHSMAEAGCP